MELEELQGAKRKVDKELEALQERIDELTAENQKVNRSKKKVQEEVRESAASFGWLGAETAREGSCSIYLAYCLLTLWQSCCFCTVLF